MPNVGLNTHTPTQHTLNQYPMGNLVIVTRLVLLGYERRCGWHFLLGCYNCDHGSQIKSLDSRRCFDEIFLKKNYTDAIQPFLEQGFIIPYYNTISAN